MVTKTKTRKDLIIFMKSVKCEIVSVKLLFLNNLGPRLNSSDTSPKNYWNIMHRAVNRSRAAKIPPISNNEHFVLKCTEKTNHFNKYFAKQCMLIINDCAFMAYYNLQTSLNRAKSVGQFMPLVPMANLSKCS